MTENPYEPERTDPDRVVFHTSRGKLVLMIVGAALFVALSAWLVTVPRTAAKVAGWAGLVVFGLFAVAGVWHILAGGPRLIVDARGVEDVRSGMGTILWEDILAVEVHELERQRFISLTLRDPRKYLECLRGAAKVLAGANMRLGFGDYTLPSSGMNASFDEILQAIRQRRPQAVAGNQAPAEGSP
jgi:hypothetical protein